MTGIESDDIEWMREHWPTDLYGEPSTFLAMGALMRTHRVMIDTIDEQLRRYNLTRNGYLVLVTLSITEHGRRLPGRLAQALLVHPTTITLVLEKLEEQQLVTRDPKPDDRRATYATITKRGRNVVRQASQHLAAHGYGLGGLSRAEADTLIEALRTARRRSGDIRTHPPEHDVG